jgi:serine/threonine protein phosphatase PrpC
MSHTPTTETLEMPTLVNVNYLPPGELASLVNVETAALSVSGRVRPNNEDHFLVARFDRTMRTLFTNVSEGAVPEKCTESAYGMLVADGIGGHSGGEIASETAIVTIVDMVLRTPDWIMRLDEERTRQVLDRMEKRLEGAQEALADRANQEKGLAGMGTTMTLAASLGMDAIIAHVGDSRAYLMRQGELSQVTHDHTMAQALVDQGDIRPEQAATHRLRHVLTNVIGGKDKKLRVDLHHLTLQDGDQLLLCTDGLSDMVKDGEIAAVLRDSANAGKACCDLIGLALEAGGKDNVTVALARYCLPERDTGDLCLPH